MRRNFFDYCLRRLVGGMQKNSAWLSNRVKWITGWGAATFCAMRRYTRRRPFAASAFAFTTMAALMFSIVLAVAWRDIPSRETLAEFRNPVPSELYTADSVLIGRFYLQDRTPVPPERISPYVSKAVIATEDIRFYQHRGIDWESIGRVLFKTILMQDESSGGGSTITQQLVKNIFPRKDYWLLSLLVNKIRESLAALRVESLYSKEEILNLYLNTVPFGDNTYGIEAAARRFFSVSAADLSIEQSAVLIGMLKATHSYNPRLFPEASRARRDVVLSQMEKYGFLEDADQWKTVPLVLHLGKVRQDSSMAPYFRDFVKQLLLEWCENNKKPNGEPYNLYTDGLIVHTTIDSRLQRYAELAVQRHMPELQRQFFRHWKDHDPWGNTDQVIFDALRRTARFRALDAEGLKEDEMLKFLSEPVATQSFTWEGIRDSLISPIDSIKHHIQLLHAGFVAMEPSTGEVRAWVGGIDHNFFQYDHVRASTRRQVGSVFKPVVYAQAIEEGIPPCSLISASQETYIDDEGKEWKPKNARYDYPVLYSMKGALAYSVNTVSVKLINRAGIRETVALAHRMGIEAPIPEVPSIALGASAISVIEMTTAYATIANDGVTTYPVYIRSITDRDNKRFLDFANPGSGKRAMSEETASMVRYLLQGVIKEGTASRIRYRYGIYSDLAGKTGTTQDNADGWFLGFTPDLAMGCWVGADDPRIRFRETRLGEGANTALPIVAYFMQAVSKDASTRSLTSRKFAQLSPAVRNRLQCDLYEMSDDLMIAIEKSIHKRDSILQADTLRPPPPETFLQSLYARKLRMMDLADASGTGANK